MLQRLHRFLHLLAAAMFAGTIAELIAAKHYQDGVQFIPFALCAAGLIAVLAAWRRPDHKTLRSVRVLLIVIALGSLWGIWEHVEGNLAFVHEVRPHADTATVIRSTLQGGAPILAPAALAAAAAVGIAATYASIVLAPVSMVAVRSTRRAETFSGRGYATDSSRD
ncbi:MAG: hypothetical protein C4346_09555 [Chloroflexota bacterium]